MCATADRRVVRNADEFHQVVWEQRAPFGILIAATGATDPGDISGDGKPGSGRLAYNATEVGRATRPRMSEYAGGMNAGSRPLVRGVRHG